MLEAHQRQEAFDARRNLGLGHARDFQRQRHVAVHRAARQQVESLEHHADTAALSAQLRFIQAGQGLAADGDGAFVRAFQQVDALDQRAFSGPAGADDAKDLALLDMQVDASQRLEFSMRRGIGLG
ncbi:hypothetical protein D3C72_2132240 [compost metagenome]